MAEVAITVIVPVWNGEREIALCLDALCAHVADREDVEIIVVDNGSTDRTAEVVHRYDRVLCLHEPIASSYRARNRGIAAARGDLLLFTDADCVPTPGWIDAALAAARAAPGAGVIGGPVAVFDDGRAGAAARNYDQLFSFDQELNIRNGKCITANWLSPAAVLKAVGGFDATLKSGGDVECSRRIRAAGYALYYAPDMVVRHPPRASVAEIVRKRRRVVGGRWQAARSTKASVPRWLGTFSLDSAAEVKRVLLSDLDAASKVQLIGVVTLLWASGLGELARMATGGEARRA